MAKLEGRVRRSLRIHLKNDKLASRDKLVPSNEKLASSVAKPTLTLASGSTIKGNAPISPAAAIVLTTTSDPALSNDMLATTPTETSDHAIEDDTLVSTATITTPVSTSDSPISLFRLPRELREYIYTYVSFAEATWIGSLPLVGKQHDVIVEEDTIRQSATFIKTNSSIIAVSREVRDEFRTAVWRNYMKSDRQVDLRLYDFACKPLRTLASSSPLDLQGLLGERDCHVDVRSTEAFEHYRTTMDHRSLRALVQSLIMNWLLFCHDIGLEAEHSFDGCRWDDSHIVAGAIKSRRFRHHDVLRTDPNINEIKIAVRKSLNAHFIRLRALPVRRY